MARLCVEGCPPGLAGTPRGGPARLQPTGPRRGTIYIRLPPIYRGGFLPPSVFWGLLPRPTWHTGCNTSRGRHGDAEEETEMDRRNESGRVGYLVLYLMGVPIGLLILLWVLLGNNLIGAG